jgi:hypothetical protein
MLLFLNLMFSLNKNLFFERMPFLKSKSPRTNAIGYGVLTVVKDHILSWVCLFLLLKILNHSGFALCLIAGLLFIKLLRIDNMDWKLYFRNDFRLACPEPRERFLTVLGGNLVKALLFEDFTPLYILAFVLFTPLDPLTALAVYGFFVALYVFVLTYYFLLETGSLGIKKVYSFLSYAFSMVSTFLVVYVLLNVIVTLVGSIDFLVFKEDPMQIMNAIQNDLTALADSVSAWVTGCSGWLALVLVPVSLVLLVPVGYTVLRNHTEGGDLDDNALAFPKLLERHSGLFCKTPVHKAFFTKELQLFSYLYRYNFKQYWFAICFDRSMATLLAVWAVLYGNAIAGSGLIFFCLALIMVTLDISSQVGVKMITNFSFISDFNTLRMANTNGLDLAELVSAKLRFFYGVRMVPMLCSCAIAVVCLLTLGAPWYMAILLAVSCLLIMWVYPSVYITNNRINTKMHYRDYEKYLEESKILDSGVEDFLPLSMTYKAKVILLLGCVIAAVLLAEVRWLYVVIAAAMALLGLADHFIMKRIQTNILQFIRGGDYSADIKKIFRSKDSSC